VIPPPQSPSLERRGKNFSEFPQNKNAPLLRGMKVFPPLTKGRVREGLMD